MEEINSPCASDFTDFELIRHESHWEMGYKEYDFKCMIKGEETIVHFLMQRHDEGYGFTIHTDENDIYERMSRGELLKLEDKLQEEIQYGLYHEDIIKLAPIDDCKDLEFELMENNDVFLNRVLKRLWPEMSAKERELEKKERPSVKDALKEKQMKQVGQTKRSNTRKKSKIQEL